MTHAQQAPSAATHSSSDTAPVTVIRGDGIGPEVVDAALRVMREAGAKLDIEECRAGAEVFKSGDQTGVPDETIDSIQRTGVAFKGPLETPIGYGEKSANVTLRKLFETYANVRPARELPGVKTPFAGRNIDLVVVRENVEDLYAGIEHMQSPSVAQSLKVITKHGSEKVARLAFEFARAEGRRSVTCATKANIMKMSEGLFKRTFDEVAAQYPDIEARQILIDNCAHQLVIRPEQFDVILTTNMNGDILSDLTSGLVGGLGFAPSANIGTDTAMFEAVHGSAPDIAGRDLANPTAIMLSAVMLLRHVGQATIASTIEDAILVTLEDGLSLTGDIARDRDPVGTTAFTDTVIENLGRVPRAGERRESRPLILPPASWKPEPIIPQTREVIGADVFIEEATLSIQAFGTALDQLCEDTPLKLRMVSNRGTKVYPGDVEDTVSVDIWRARFVRRDEGIEVSDEDLLTLLGRVAESFRWVHVEKLNLFDGAPSFTKAQGEE
jgi:isocitrate dehydrogenase